MQPIARAHAGHRADVAADATISVIFSWLANYRSGLHRDCVTCRAVFQITSPALVVLLTGGDSAASREDLGVAGLIWLASDRDRA